MLTNFLAALVLMGTGVGKEILLRGKRANEAPKVLKLVLFCWFVLSSKAIECDERGLYERMK